MRSRFKKGDIVKLARPETHGRYGIPHRYFGEMHKVCTCHPGGEYECILVGGGSRWLVCDDMLDPGDPLTPFDQRVQDYIARELS